MEHEELTRLGGNPDQHVHGNIGSLGAAAQVLRQALAELRSERAASLEKSQYLVEK